MGSRKGSSSSEIRQTEHASTEIALAVRGLFQEATRLAMQSTAELGLKSGDMRALRILDTVAAERPTIGNLAERLNLAPQSTTELVDRLERAGMVRRERDLSDRRRVFLVLTTRAEKFGEEMLRPISLSITEAIAAARPEELVHVQHFLSTLTGSLDRQRNTREQLK
jgi:DNA-binding MarR family transcriptional regulator